MKDLFLTIDTETANTLDDPLCYDVGGCIHDEDGNVYHTFSYVVYEIFFDEKALMEESYFAEKIPQYLQEIKNGERKVARFSTIKKQIADLCKEYQVKAIIAHNARFDYKSLSTTQRFLTSSKYRFFLPYEIPIYDTLKMARNTIVKTDEYKVFCKENGFVAKNGNPRATAEVLYKYLSNNLDFTESHTGLQDVLIEKEIFVKCLELNPEVDRECFTPKIYCTCGCPCPMARINGTCKRTDNKCKWGLQ